MFVFLDPVEKGFPADKLSATERNGRDGRAAGHATGDSFADMRFRAVQQLGYIGECQKIEII